jgi:hypothetical protein
VQVYRANRQRVWRTVHFSLTHCRAEAGRFILFIIKVFWSFKHPTWVYYMGKAFCSSRNSHRGIAQKITLAIVSHTGQGVLALPETAEVTWKRPNESQAPMVVKTWPFGLTSPAPERLAGPATCFQVLVFSLGNSKVRRHNSPDDFCSNPYAFSLIPFLLFRPIAHFF